MSVDDLEDKYDHIINLLDKPDQIPLDPINILSCALAVNNLSVLSLTNRDIKEALSLNSQANNYFGQYAGFAVGQSVGIGKGINDASSNARLKKSIKATSSLKGVRRRLEI